MIKYAEKEKLKGNLGPIVKKIILKTGMPNTMFKYIKYSIYNVRIQEIEDLFNQYNFQKDQELNQAQSVNHLMEGESKRINSSTNPKLISEKEKRAR